jgi:hypothetical protein
MATNPSSPNFSTPELERGSSMSETAQARPAGYLRALPQYGVILCTEHQCCYTLQSLSEHLKRSHSVKGKQAKQIKSWAAEQNIATEVTTPPDYSPFIHGLQHEEGFVCNAVTCHYRVASEQKIQRHCSKEYGVDVRRKQKERGMYSKVMLQFLLAKNPQYFIVQLSSANATTASAGGPTPMSTPTRPPLSIPPTPLTTTDSQQSPSYDSQLVSSALSVRIRSATDRRKERYRQIREPNHISEITPWLRKSRFHQHLTGLDAELIASSQSLPSTEHHDDRLYQLIWSVERVLRKAYDLVLDLYHVDARILNTFQVGTVTQDPFQQLQNQRSLNNYINVFQAAMCYYVRVLEGHFEQEMFIVTPQQQAALDKAFGVIGRVNEYEAIAQREHRRPPGQMARPSHREPTEDELERNSRSEDEQEQGSLISTLEAELDGYIFDFCAALVQQRVTKTYDSAIASFCAVRSTLVHHEEKTITFRPEGEVSGILSKLIYCCQLILLQSAQNTAEQQQVEEITEPLEAVCQEWLRNNTRGPIGILSDWRLYAMKVGASTVPPALIV